MRYFLLIPLLALAACKTADVPEPQVVIQRVNVPVSAPCVPASHQPPPQYVDTDQALRDAADAAVRYALLWAGREQRESRLNELEPIVEGCPKEGE